MAGAAHLKQELIDSGFVLDPEGTHHELTSGMHGRKLDFDEIETDSPLYDLWTETAADFLRQQFPRLPEVIIGVAGGANRTALDTARRFDGRVIGAVTEKHPGASKKIYLSSVAGRIMEAMRPRLVVVLEDVSTTGGNSVQVATDCRDAGAQNVEVVTTWKRREKLERLEEAGVPYRAIIDEPLPTYSPEDCREDGFCAKGWELIERS